MNTATLVQDRLKGFKGHAALYKLSEPLSGYNWDDKKESHQYQYVICSSVYVSFSGPETYIFPANSEGEITDWRELPGSMKGNVSHSECLAEAGYELIISQ